MNVPSGRAPSHFMSVEFFSYSCLMLVLTKSTFVVAVAALFEAYFKSLRASFKEFSIDLSLSFTL